LCDAKQRGGGLHSSILRDVELGIVLLHSLFEVHPQMVVFVQGYPQVKYKVTNSPTESCFVSISPTNERFACISPSKPRICLSLPTKGHFSTKAPTSEQKRLLFTHYEINPKRLRLSTALSGAK